MGASQTRKRKRQESESDTAQKADHVPATLPADALTTTADTGTTTASKRSEPQSKAATGGERKQARSERRSKKVRSQDSGHESQALEAVNDLQKHGARKQQQQNKGSSVARPSDAEEEELDGSAQRKKKTKKSSAQPVDGDATSTAKQRFICFIGNLPYTATTEQIQDHFASLAPAAIRHRTDKKTGRSKGFAFLEFDAYDRMKTCLKLYHHSIFDPGNKDDAAVQSRTVTNGSSDGSKDKRRRINVELTAGGGGKSAERKAKIKVKNSKLEDERARRFAKEKTEQEEMGKEKAERPGTGANAPDDRGSVHPSRLGRVQH